MDMLVGIDGGGTQCRARIRRLDGTLIGEATGGTANLLAGVDDAVATLTTVVGAALRTGGLAADRIAACHAGLGLAGANVASLAASLRARALPFASWTLESDAEVACRGAFPDRDGAIAILGTGTAYVVRAGGRFTSLGGWGMMVSDHGSGADLGRAALTAAVLALDGVTPRTGMCDAILREFQDDAGRVAVFADRALPRDFARFAPLVWDRADAGDPAASSIVRQATDDVERMLRRAIALGAPAIALLGGLAPRYTARLSPDLRALVAAPAGDAMEGGIDLARSVLGRAEGVVSGECRS
ncbi:BadF/BadG/BcrA/BcrD ATPase family protein [Marinivivus vitaminiproducens]|uniref:BadF/BadG/BcrA/BcrD ATPase family protein n=1 Tax=Marinivivus vitaminiproducens TaxID=3035935 RepID=UPI0027A61E37|nr:BadF/BadG/BcrA/BcrD ATPase family protein [Geminicoccaceae bacterium SCSIO 64248]